MHGGERREAEERCRSPPLRRPGQRDRSDEKGSLQATSLAELKLLVEDSRGAGTTLAGGGAKKPTKNALAAVAGW